MLRKLECSPWFTGESAIRDEDVLSAALYPKVFNDYMVFRDEFGPVDGLPTRLFFTGPEIGEEFQVAIEPGKVLNIKVLAISNLHPNGQREVFCEMNGQLRTVMVEDKSVTKVLIYFNERFVVDTLWKEVSSSFQRSIVEPKPK